MSTRVMPAMVVLIPVLGALSAFAPMSIDMYLPSTEHLVGVFDTTTERVQWTLSSFIFGYAIAHMFWGPVSDRYGRRPLLVIGVGLYTIASLGCLFAPSVEAMIGLRGLQGLGAAAAPLLARAVVRDMFDRERGARILSLMWMVMSMAPMLAPIIGGQLFKYLGWESVFWVLTIFGVICLVLVVSVLGESLPPDRRTRHNPLEMAASYGELLIHRRFLGYSLCGSFLFAAMFAYISSTPFVFIGLYGVTEEQYGFLFATHVAVMTIGAYINSRIVERFGLDPIIRWGAVWAAAMGCVVLFFAATGIGGVVGLLIPFALRMFAVPLVSANAVAGAMGEFPHLAGTAAALNGMLSFALGAIGSAVVAYLYNDTALPMGAGICGFGILSLLVYVFVLRGAPPPAKS